MAREYLLVRQTQPTYRLPSPTDGNTTQDTQVAFSGNKYAISTDGNQTGIAAANDTIIGTTDKGASWTTIIPFDAWTSPTQSTSRTYKFTNAFYVVGDRGFQMWRIPTNLVGPTLIQPPVGSATSIIDSSVFAVLIEDQVVPGNIIAACSGTTAAATDDFLVSVSTDGGLTFPGWIGVSLDGSGQTAQGALGFALADRSLIISDSDPITWTTLDGGLSWSVANWIGQPLGYFSWIEKIGNTLIGGDTFDANIYQSTDGVNWSLLTAAGPLGSSSINGISGVTYTPEDGVMMITFQEEIFQSLDGGVTWLPAVPVLNFTNFVGIEPWADAGAPSGPFWTNETFCIEA